MPKKRTREDEQNEQNFIDSTSLIIVRNIEKDGTLRASTLRLVHAVMIVVRERERTDRCYYCRRSADKVELGVERDTKLTQCMDCAGAAYGERLEATNQLRDRLNQGYML